MKYFSRDEVIFQLILSKEIGSGSQGTCYLNPITKEVYKIFNQFFDKEVEKDELVKYSGEEIMRYSHLVNETFIFPKGVITLNDEVIGYITNYVRAKPLSQINPLYVSLNELINSIELAQRDIKYLSDNKVSTYDMFYNILYGDKFYVTDTDSFGHKIDGITYLDYNLRNFSCELYLFLIDGFFNEFINKYGDLKKMYKTNDPDIIYFIKLLKKYLSEYLGYELNELSSAQKVLNKSKRKINYIRFL